MKARVMLFEVELTCLGISRSVCDPYSDECSRTQTSWAASRAALSARVLKSKLRIRFHACEVEIILIFVGFTCKEG